MGSAPFCTPFFAFLRTTFPKRGGAKSERGALNERYERTTRNNSSRINHQLNRLNHRLNRLNQPPPFVHACHSRLLPLFTQVYVDGTFGSQALSDSITKALKADNVTACLLANHGAICYSTGSLPKALSLATEVETLAKQYVYATMGSTLPIILSDEEMKVILAKFKTYGKQNGELACLCQFDQDHAIVAPPKLG